MTFRQISSLLAAVHLFLLAWTSWQAPQAGDCCAQTAVQHALVLAQSRLHAYMAVAVIDDTVENIGDGSMRPTCQACSKAACVHVNICAHHIDVVESLLLGLPLPLSTSFLLHHYDGHRH